MVVRVVAPPTDRKIRLVLIWVVVVVATTVVVVVVVKMLVLGAEDHPLRLAVLRLSLILKLISVTGHLVCHYCRHILFMWVIIPPLIKKIFHPIHLAMRTVSMLAIPTLLPIIY